MKALLTRIGLTTKRRVLAALGVGLVVFVVFSVGAVEATSTASFCNSCHIMEPYYSSWKHSAHKDVQCVKCHIDPGLNNFFAAKFNGLGQVVDDVLHRTSMKPSAAVSHLACMRSGCHDPEKVRKYEKTSGKYLFKHAKHIDLEYAGIKLACSTCHSHVQGSEHFEVNTNVCVTCHLVESSPSTTLASNSDSVRTLIRLGVRSSTLQSPATPDAQDAPDATASPASPTTDCAKCHNPPSGTLVRGDLKINHADYLAYGAKCASCHRNATEIPVPIESGQCLRCHNFGLERAQPAEEAHRTHLQGKHKIECFDCHGTIHHGPTAQQAKLETLDCQRCHTDQHNIQRSTYLHTNGDSHAPDPHAAQTAITKPADETNPMFLAHVDCNGCHVKERPVSVKPDSGARVTAASPEGCNKCHKPGFGEKMIPLWQKTTHQLWDQVSELLAKKQAQPGANPETIAEVQRILTQVRVDGSWGVHNPRYTQKLLESARKSLNEIPASPGAGGPP